ncbi:MAG: hypothetical protein HYV97_11325 [Bdellovibrio sp.]|nr:hypothetical protein [Bdellovibrio sp.]
MKKIYSIVLLVLLSGFSLPAIATMELKSNLLPSYAAVGKNDFILSSHNTLLFGFKEFKLGAYFGYEPMHSYLVDQSVGAAIRFGESNFFELQAGGFQRNFKQQGRTYKGTGFIVNALYGKHWGRWSLSLLLTGKRISSGDLDKRWIIDFLPYLGFRVAI